VENKRTKDKLRALLVQLDTKWNDIHANFTKIEQILSKEIKNTAIDIVVLPEMFQTGFNMNPSECAEKHLGPTYQWMSQIATKYNLAITGSVSIIHESKYYNRLYFVTSDGYQYYNKRHLFSLANEDKSFESGAARTIIEYKGWRILPLICYDLRFPIWSRNDLEYDIMMIVANWPSVRINHWDHLLKARAIENVSYVIAVNRVGADGNGWQFNGHTQCLFPNGETNVFIGDVETTITAELDKELVKSTRQKTPFLEDRDLFQILE